jgi:nucleoside-diphosphate-sugar epimerase
LKQGMDAGRRICLVTGATGLVGQRLVKKLIQEGSRVRALVRGNPDRVNSLGAEAVQGDLTEPSSLDTAVAGAECVYHCAAKVGDWGSESLFQQVNVEGTRRLLSAAKRAGNPRFIYVSTFAVYGADLLRDQPCIEDNPLSSSVLSAYARSKRVAETLCRESSTASFAPTIVRPGNIYGPGSALWVHEVVRVLRAGGLPLIESGRPFATLAYVDNVVDLLILAARTPAAAGRIYNVNDGNGVTWRQYLHDVAEIIHAPKPGFPLPGRVASVAGALMEGAARILKKVDRPMLTREAVRVLRCHAPVTIDLARRELGYEPAVSYAQGLEHVRNYLNAIDKGGTYPS